MAAVESTLPSPVEPSQRLGFVGLMRNRNYALLWSGQLVSEFGTRLHFMAVALWIFARTESAFVVSAAVAAMYIGPLLFGLWAGVIVDRFSRKTILVISDFVRAGLVALIPWLMSVDIIYVYADLMLISIATTFFRPAMFAVVPQIVRKEALLEANAFFAAMDNATDIAGPALAGLLVGFAGYQTALYFDAVTYVFSGVCVLAMLVPRLVEVAEKVTASSLWRDAVEGVRYIRRDALQWALFLLIFPATLVGSGLNALQTPLAKGAVGITDPQFGVFQTVWGAGIFISSLLIGWFGQRASKSWLILGGYFLHYVMTAFMGLSWGYTPLLIAGFGVGFANAFYFVGLGTVLMAHTPATMVGRVISTRQVAIGVLRIATPLMFGAAADAFGVRPTTMLLAVIGALATVAAVARIPVLRNLDARTRGAPLASPAPGPFADWLLGPVRPGFDTLSQQRLNAITLVVVLIVWLFTFIRAPFAGVALLVIVAGAATLTAWRRQRTGLTRTPSG